MAEELVFDDLGTKEVPVKLAGRDYVLRGASASTGKWFRSASARCARMQEGKVTGMDGVGDIAPELVSRCLFEQLELTKQNGHRERPVQLQVVLGWNDEVVQALYDKCMELSPSLRERKKLEELRSELRRTQSIIDDPSTKDNLMVSLLDRRLDLLEKIEREGEGKKNSDPTSQPSGTPSSE